MARLTGKVAIITGGASGIGAAIARRFASEGAAVCVSDLHADPARALAEELSRQGARAIAIAADVTDEGAVAALVDRTAAELGPLDVMVNNAGIGERPVPIEERPTEEWTRVIATNLNSVFFGIKHAARAMKAAGRGGVILNMSSILGSVGFSGAPAYTAAKHGVNGLTKAAALELAAAKIRVVAVAPAFIRTPLIAGMEDAVLPLHSIGRLGEAAEVASLCAFLASDEASFITGV
jgi:NAD(P)-dependent dehydrogenase (short-subunit alcohol dehydrogenase family)